MKYFIFIYFICLSWLLNAQSLSDYQQLASQNNPGLQAKYKSFEAAMEKVSQVGGLPDPNLLFGYFISPVETRVGPQRARISLTQMFPWFGTLKSQENVAALLAEAKYQEFLDAGNQLNYQVAASYYPLFELHGRIAIEKENIALLESYKNIATRKFENNKGSMVDVLRVDIMLKEATTNLSILTKKQLPLETRFNKFLNRQEDEPVLLPDSVEIEDLPDEFRRDSLFISNPLLDELDLRIRASEAGELAAIKQGFPKLGVGLDYVIVSERTDMMVADNGKNALMPMVTISIPIYRKKYASAQNEARLMQESFQLQKEETANLLTSSYEMIWFEIQKQQELIQLYDQQIIESERSLRLLFTTYANDNADFEEVLRMQQQLLSYQKMKVSALAEYQIAIAELNYITSKSN